MQQFDVLRVYVKDTHFPFRLSDPDFMRCIVQLNVLDVRNLFVVPTCDLLALQLSLQTMNDLECFVNLCTACFIPLILVRQPPHFFAAPTSGRIMFPAPVTHAVTL